MLARNEDIAEYKVDRTITQDEEEVLEQAWAILRTRLDKSGDLMTDPTTVKRYLTITYAQLPHEEFGCMWLDARNRLIVCGSMFRGTLHQTSVYPREVVKEGLHHNAACVVFFHNHPSGNPEPSRADELLTKALKDALALVDIRVIDHIIVAGVDTYSFAERGLL